MLALLALVGFGSLAAEADATWYWSEARAENRLYATTPDYVTDVICDGRGRSWRGMYHRFACDQFSDDWELWKCDDGYIGTATLTPTSRSYYRLTYGQDWC